jgi:cytochrome c-type biogenesis protein CcmH/NrfF
MMRRVLVLLGALAIGAAVVVGVWQASRPAQQSLQQRVTSVTENLRCPSCSGQSVAASESDMAQQMKAVATQQLAAGRTPDQVRAWFAERYGDGVLLDPPARGWGLALVAVPLVVLAGGVVVLARRRGRRRLAAVAVVAVAVAALPVVLAGRSDGGTARTSGFDDASAAAAVAALPAPSASASTPSASQSATSSATSDASVLSEAVRTLSGGDAQQAERLASQVLGQSTADSAATQEAMLVLGLAQRQLGDPQADDTLRAFLAAAPHHPAAARVRQLLDGGS